MDASGQRRSDLKETRIACRLNLSRFPGRREGATPMPDSSDVAMVGAGPNRAWLVEMNRRVTQICHLSLSKGTDLVRALYMQMKRPSRRPSPVLINRDLIALFPNEIIRSSTRSLFPVWPA
jgi:hypothetical protein